jgi:hypothetical protein
MMHAQPFMLFLFTMFVVGCESLFVGTRALRHPEKHTVKNSDTITNGVNTFIAGSFFILLAYTARILLNIVLEKAEEEKQSEFDGAVPSYGASQYGHVEEDGTSYNGSDPSGHPPSTYDQPQHYGDADDSMASSSYQYPPAPPPSVCAISSHLFPS